MVELVDALPLSILLAEDEDAAVVAAAREDGAVFGVSPGDAPDGAVVTAKSVRFASEAIVFHVHTLSVSLLICVDLPRSRRS